MEKDEERPFGYIYQATNLINDKKYIGQTATSRWKAHHNPIEERWKEEIGEAFRKERRGDNLRLIERAITKYGPDNFVLKELDTALSQQELDARETHWINEFDTMNPEMGYNLKEGGLGGSLSEEAKESLSKAISEKYQTDQEYYEKQVSERRERAQDPEWVDKMTEINRERAQNPEWVKKVSEVGKEVWQNPDYVEKQLKERSTRADNPEFMEKMREIGRASKKEIENKREFLRDIKDGMSKREMLSKYDIGKTAYGKRINEMFGLEGPKNYTELKEYLQDKNIEDVLKEINERIEYQGEKNEELKDTKEDEMKEMSENKEEHVPENSESKENLQEAKKGDIAKDVERKDMIKEESSDTEKEEEIKPDQEEKASDEPSMKTRGSEIQEEEREISETLFTLKERNLTIFMRKLLIDNFTQMGLN